MKGLATDGAPVEEEIERAIRRALELDGEIWRDPRRLGSVLQDLCPGRPVHSRVLCLGAQEVVAALLPIRSSAAPSLGRSEFRRLVTRLEVTKALSRDWADWAVRAWCSALGLKLAPSGPPLQKIVARAVPSLSSVRRVTEASRLGLGKPGGAVAATRWALGVAFCIAAILAVLFGLLMRHPFSKALVSPPVQPVAADSPDWREAARLAKLETTFVGHRSLSPTRSETLVLQVHDITIQPDGRVGRFLYVLNSRGQRANNIGTLSLTDGRVELPDLGAGQARLDTNGRAFLDGGDPHLDGWRLNSLR